MSQTSHSSDVFLAALEPPTYQVGGKVFVGVFVSADEWWPLAAKVAEVMRPESSRDDERAVMQELTDATFPKPWWAFWRRSVWSHVRRQPYNAQLEAIHSFTKAQALANDPNVWAREKTRRMGGNDSPV